MFRRGALEVKIDPALVAVFEHLLTFREPDGRIGALGLDAKTGVLGTLHWQPGKTLELETTRLSGPIIAHPAALSRAGKHLLISDAHGCLMVIEHDTGVVTRLPEIPAPAVLTPNGRAIVSVTGTGLMVLQFQHDRKAMIKPGTLRPVLVSHLERPASVMIVAGKDDMQFQIGVGGEGCIGLFDVLRLGPPALSIVRHEVAATTLPYDPIRLQSPAPLRDGPGAYLYACDWGFARLSAVGLDDAGHIPWPLETKTYHSITLAAPRLDGRQCLVRDRAGRFFCWTPGKVPVPIRAPRGHPILWIDGLMLLLDWQTGRLWEEAIRV